MFSVWADLVVAVSAQESARLESAHRHCKTSSILLSTSRVALEPNRRSISQQSLARTRHEKFTIRAIGNRFDSLEEEQRIPTPTTRLPLFQFFSPLYTTRFLPRAFELVHYERR